MMRGDEFKQYAAKLRSKTSHFKKLKDELADIRQETVVLSRTEAILKSRCKGLEEFMKDLTRDPVVLHWRGGGGGSKDILLKDVSMDINGEQSSSSNQAVIK